MIINNQRRQQKPLQDKFKTTRIGVLPKINEELQAPNIKNNNTNHLNQNNPLNRTIFGNYNNKQTFQKTTSKPSSNSNNNNNTIIINNANQNNNKNESIIANKENS